MSTLCKRELSSIDIAAEADRLYALRDDVAHTVIKSVRLIEEHSRRLDYEMLWRLSRAHFFLGQCAGNDSHKARKHHRAGAQAGINATRIEALRVEGYFWAGVNLALRANVENHFRKLPLALAARRALRRSIEFDETYHAAGPLRVLARLESKIPALFSGNRAQAHRSFERAIKLAPRNTVTRRYFAELLLENGDKEQAADQLRLILAMEVDPGWEFETHRDQTYAREMLDEL